MDWNRSTCFLGIDLDQAHNEARRPVATLPSSMRLCEF